MGGQKVVASNSLIFQVFRRLCLNKKVPNVGLARQLQLSPYTQVLCPTDVVYKRSIESCFHHC